MIILKKLGFLLFGVICILPMVIVAILIVAILIGILIAYLGTINLGFLSNGFIIMLYLIGAVIGIVTLIDWGECSFNYLKRKLRNKS